VNHLRILFLGRHMCSLINVDFQWQTRARQWAWAKPNVIGPHEKKETSSKLLLYSLRPEKRVGFKSCPKERVVPASAVYIA
jgi:hypothetical protein